MSWWRRQGSSGEPSASEAGVASDLAQFLVESTEEKALMQAIGDARSHSDKSTVAPTSGDAPPSRAGDEQSTGAWTAT